MACDGPSQEYAYSIGEKAAAEFIETLRVKYNINPPHPVSAAQFGHIAKMAEEWVVLEKRLKDTVKEMVWLDHASSW